MQIVGLCNSVTNFATLTLNTPTTADPLVSQTNCPGTTVSFSTLAHGTGPFSYQWVKDGTPPPPSTYPKIADATLVPLANWNFPKIPGVNKPHEASLAYHLDFGPRWNEGIVSFQPPKVGKPFPILVPQVDSDGNDLGGVNLPELQVPLATYTGWNLRDPSIGAPDLRLSFYGSFIPFARKAAERQKSGDPRLSVAERYASRDAYLGKFAMAAKKLIDERFLLPEDMPAVLERGNREWEEVVGKE